jgi:pectate lyase
MTLFLRFLAGATLVTATILLPPAFSPAYSPTTDATSVAGTVHAAPMPVDGTTAVQAAARGIVGYGRRTVGGRGGSVGVVRNLNNAGPGSLRRALEGSGRRVVDFRVSGTIRLSAPIKINSPFLTVNGRGAGSRGITVRGDAVVIQTHDVIFRHLRLRPGDRSENPSETDALTINGNSRRVYNVVIDHVSMLWGPDIGALAILGDVSHVTIQNSIMGEGLYLSAHPEATRSNGGHSTAVNVTGMDPGAPAPRYLTFWRNLFTTSDQRMPRLQGTRCVDIVNNVIFNWGLKPATGNPRSLNLVGNWFRRGPRTERLSIWHSEAGSSAPTLFVDSIYQRGNVADGFRFSRGGVARVFTGQPRCGGLSVRRGSASDARAAVLRGAGATLPSRDAVDRRVIGNVRDRVGRYFNGAGYPAPNPY